MCIVFPFIVHSHPGSKLRSLLLIARSTRAATATTTASRPAATAATFDTATATATASATTTAAAYIAGATWSTNSYYATFVGIITV